MKVTLAYGKDGLIVNVPNHSKIIEPIHLERIENDHEAVLCTLVSKYGAEMSIAVMPLGPLTIAYVQE